MVDFGVNINNREPLLVEDYTHETMLELGEEAEAVGYDSVWVGDGLLDRPRLEPLVLLGNLAARTDTVTLGTACLVAPLRNPIQLAQAWNSLDMLSDGRMIMGACMGPPTERCRKQYEVVDTPSKRRARVLTETVAILKQFWREGEVTHSGDIYDFDGVTFHTGTEVRDLAPAQADPPILVASNPTLHGTDSEDVFNRAAHRIVDLADGWLTSGMSDDPDAYERQWNAIKTYADRQDVDPGTIDRAFQVTMTLGDDTAHAERKMRSYIETYYPHLSGETDLDEWGPRGDSTDLVRWIEEFRDRGCNTFIVRFAGEDQRAQMRQFADDVMPAFR
jgi:alkanesulfonate monooxygenase SsuD/methylene tetrahydromethanopterin reductase-like flavin-dependent oxidoreductase (luciferase family)